MWPVHLHSRRARKNRQGFGHVGVGFAENWTSSTASESQPPYAYPASVAAIPRSERRPHLSRRVVFSQLIESGARKIHQRCGFGGNLPASVGEDDTRMTGPARGVHYIYDVT